MTRTQSAASADTSVLVAAFATWHESHDVARRALRRVTGVVAHAAWETYSVLTRLPDPHRVAGDVVTAWLATLPATWLALSGDDLRRALTDAERRGISGGAIYDALILATATGHEQVLLTLDLRALATYRRMDGAVEMLSGGTS